MHRTTIGLIGCLAFAASAPSVTLEAGIGGRRPYRGPLASGPTSRSTTGVKPGFTTRRSRR